MLQNDQVSMVSPLHLRTGPIWEERERELRHVSSVGSLGTEGHIDRALRIITSSAPIFRPASPRSCLHYIWRPLEKCRLGENSPQPNINLLTGNQMFRFKKIHICRELENLRFNHLNLQSTFVLTFTLDSFQDINWFGLKMEIQKRIKNVVGPFK